ncbi:MAG TPA: phenylalanine--tRNA ligase subunit alpha [Candidatus Acidoferrum sp.]|nr:phenylalanine--tRNA ligase subunit alpha [Candidatus Acidoferrum sp.]
MKHDISAIETVLKTRLSQLPVPRDILKAAELKELYASMKAMAPDERPVFGKQINLLRNHLEAAIGELEASGATGAIKELDVTAPFEVNATAPPRLLTSEEGSRHPLSAEREKVAEIFARMGFTEYTSRELDDDYHMFGALNFPEGHPARDVYDTFITEDGLIAPAHTSTMQNRILRAFEPPIRAVIIDRTFRNEDVDARHEHTFNQIEGVYVDKNINVGHLLATLKAFLESYYETNIEFRIQPFYFPFVEPGFEFALSCPFCRKKGCHICSYQGWIELLGCGMIHPNVLREGGIDPALYSGFAWGVGLDRLVMMKHDIEDIRHFQSGKLDFLRQFS